MSRIKKIGTMLKIKCLTILMCTKIMKQYLEDNLQAECYKWYNNTYCLKHHKPRHSIFSVPNGGTRNSFEAAKFKATGLKPGVADIIILMPEAKTIFVEFKTDTGVQSDVQKDFEAVVKDLGFEYHIIRSFEQFKELIESKAKI